MLRIRKLPAGARAQISHVVDPTSIVAARAVSRDRTQTDSNRVANARRKDGALAIIGDLVQAVGEADARPRRRLPFDLFEARTDPVDPGRLALSDARQPRPKRVVPPRLNGPQCLDPLLVKGLKAGRIPACVAPDQPCPLFALQGCAVGRVRPPEEHRIDVGHGAIRAPHAWIAADQPLHGRGGRSAIEARHAFGNGIAAAVHFQGRKGAMAALPQARCCDSQGNPGEHTEKCSACKSPRYGSVHPVSLPEMLLRFQRL